MSDSLFGLLCDYVSCLKSIIPRDDIMFLWRCTDCISNDVNIFSDLYSNSTESFTELKTLNNTPHIQFAIVPSIDDERLSDDILDTVCKRLSERFTVEWEVKGEGECGGTRVWCCKSKKNLYFSVVSVIRKTVIFQQSRRDYFLDYYKVFTRVQGVGFTRLYGFKFNRFRSHNEVKRKKEKKESVSSVVLLRRPKFRRIDVSL